MKKRILIVDDTPANVKTLHMLLSDSYRISIAINGADALDLVQREPPDLILLDIMMPGMDGYEVCRQLKKNSATSSIPVIFVTARSDIDDEKKGLEIGAVDYITKPISPPITLARIKNHLELKQVRDNLEQLVKERTAMLKQKVCELEARDRLVRLQLQSVDKTTANKEILSAVSTVIPARWYGIYFQAGDTMQLSVSYCDNEFIVDPPEAGKEMPLVLSVMKSGKVEQSGQLLASPVRYKDEIKAVLLLERDDTSADNNEAIDALWRMSNEAAVVLQMSDITYELQSGEVDFEALENLAEKNL